MPKALPCVRATTHAWRKGWQLRPLLSALHRSWCGTERTGAVDAMMIMAALIAFSNEGGEANRYAL